MSSTTQLSPESDIDKSEVRRVTSDLIVMFIFTAVTVPLRFFARRKLKSPLFLDDWIILGALILAAGTLWMFVESAFTQELGRHVGINGLNAQINFRKKLYFGELVSILAIGSTKLSILAFYWRIFNSSEIMRVLIPVTAGVVVCGAIGFFITSIFQCIPIHKVWDIGAEGSCINTYVFFLANPAFNIITNFSLLVLPLHSIWKLQITKPKKVEICCLLTLGGLIIVISVLRLCSLIYLKLTSADVTWNMVFPAIWLSVEIQVGIFCACLPFLRQLFIEYARKLHSAALAIFSPGKHNRHSIHSQELVQSHGSLEQLEGEEQKKFSTHRAERDQSVDEEKWQREVDEGSGQRGSWS